MCGYRLLVIRAFIACTGTPILSVVEPPFMKYFCLISLTCSFLFSRTLCEGIFLQYITVSCNTVKPRFYISAGVIKSRRMRWAGHVTCAGESGGLYRVLVGKPEGRRPLRRHKRRWEDNIKMDLQDVGCWGMDSSGQ